MLHYGMNQPTSVVITGIDKPEILDQAIEAATTFEPLPRNAGRRRSSQKRPTSRATARHERYKTTHFFDSTFQNPGWLG